MGEECIHVKGKERNVMLHSCDNMNAEKQTHKQAHQTTKQKRIPRPPMRWPRRQSQDLPGCGGRPRETVDDQQGWAIEDGVGAADGGG